VSAPEGSQRAKLKQLRELEAKTDEDHQQLVQLQATLEQERSGWGDGGAARRRARDVYRRINDDEGGDQPPVFTRASQNIAAAAILL
jgi:multidrug resistance efflux pump